MNVDKESQLSLRTYSTCIRFLPSEVTTELVNIIAEHEIAIKIHYYYLVIPFNTHHPPHMLSHSSWIRTSNKEWDNNMHLLIHQEHNKDSNLIDHPIK
jgi:hypothetical protein